MAIITGADADGADRTITFGHSTLKTIVGIDDSNDAFVINTDASFDGTLANNSLTIDTNHDITIAGDLTIAGSFKMGSDATGDVYYRNGSGVLTRLAVGSDDQVLTLASGVPSWADASGGGGGDATGVVTTSGDCTVDAQDNNTDIIFKGTTATTDTVFLTLDGGDNTAIFAGGMRVSRAAKTTTYTLLVGDHIIQCDPSGGAFTLTLPTVAAAGDGRLYIIKNATSSTNTITIDGSGAETIDDEANYTMSTPYASVTVYCDGSEWWVI